MSRGKRQLFTRPLIQNSENWLKKFKSSQNLGISEGIFAVDFISVEQAIFNNKNIRDPDLKMLHGTKNPISPPGDFDPKCGYLIGFTSEVDEGIYVDLRPSNGPIITYSNHNADNMQIVTAFQSIDDFVQFYLESHGP